MEKLKYKKFTGLRIVCNKCGYEIHNNNKINNKNCKHPAENQRYKVVVTKKGTTKKKTKTLETRDYDEAVKQTMTFKKQVDNPIIELLKPDEDKPQLLTDCMLMYVDYMNGANVPSHQINEYSNGYKSDSETYLRAFINFLSNNLKLNSDTIKVDSINDNIIGKYCEFLDKKDNTNRTINKYIVTMRTFYNYLIKTKKYDLKNYFQGVTIRRTNTKYLEENPTEIVSFDTLQKIIPLVTKENGHVKFPGGSTKNRYRDYLIDAFILGALTGRRLGEVVNMRWGDITYDTILKYGHIRLYDRKATKISKSNIKKIIYVPITNKLFEFLIKIGYEDNKYSDAYFFAPSKKNRETINKNISAAFSHYAKLYDKEKHLTFKGLRKNYITKLHISQMGSDFNIEDITGHSNFDVVDEHYLDKIEIAKRISINNFKL